MRAHWAGISLTLGIAMASACGSDDGQQQPAAGAGAGGVAGSMAAGSGGKGVERAGATNGGSPVMGGMSGSAGKLDGGAGGAVNAGEAGLSSGGVESAGGATGGVTGEGGAGPVSAAGAAGAAGACAVGRADKRVFVTSTLFTGNIGGLSAADSACQSLAEAVGLCGTFKAWLSDGTAAASERLTHASGNYLLTSGEVVASGWAGLASGALQHAINRTEANEPAPVGTLGCANNAVPVWTGTLAAGAVANTGNCGNWKSAAAGSGSGGVFGNANATNASWTQMCQLTLCNLTAALYCVEQ